MTIVGLCHLKWNKATAQETWEENGKIYYIVYGEIISFDLKDVLSVQGLGKKQHTP